MLYLFRPLAAVPTFQSGYNQIAQSVDDAIPIMTFSLRKAVDADVPVLQKLIDASVRGLQARDYSPTQIETALATVYGVDSQLISDDTYFVVETNVPAREIVGCGGWSKRKTLYGGDHWTGREDTLLDPQKDAAKIRAFFVHPAWVRRGIGTILLDACEQAAIAAGFRRLEMGATLSGVPLYKARGYEALENLGVPLANGESLPIVRMEKRVSATQHVRAPE
ncbi:MAG TPA: GNAT family N-acetyltransferase [Terriglobales bacterium]|nr:GNAT family N-acetyltransferase [Terriglobales bacterium]